MIPLENNRIELLETTKAILELMQKRANVVQEIQKFKHDNNERSWSPQQEFKIFKALGLHLKTFNLKELLQFSLMIESQAAKGSDYPKWSEREHLVQPAQGLAQQINPILLYLYNPKEYAKLELVNNFAMTLEELARSES